ncbi:MAG: STAS domain-containing protein [Desulfovermiculus sp.]|nr:STAS domain-containing protein [Desulfovermiculus sp.]
MEGIIVEKKGQTCIIRYSGELTLEVIDNFKDEIEGYLNAPDCTALVMDLSQTVFLDSSGIGFLVHINNRKTSKNKEFYLLAPSPQVRKTLSLVKLIDFFNILESETEIPGNDF